MKIISNYKDYYDHIAYQYGADPLIVYNRKPFFVDPTIQREMQNIMRLADIYHPGQREASSLQEKFKWLIINAKLYLLYAEDKVNFKLFTQNDYYDLKEYFETHFYWRRIASYEQYIGNESLTDKLIAISNKLQTPIFEYSGLYSFGEVLTHGHDIVYNYYKVPVLADLGIPSYISAEKLFQDISYFIGNVMKDSPDIKPPVEIENDLRIEGHGFDLKQSFRHRK